MEGVTKSNYNGETYTCDYSWVNVEAELQLIESVYALYGYGNPRANSGLCSVSILTPYEYLEPSYSQYPKRKEK